MSVKDGGPAFPWGYTEVGGGSDMTLKDYFAGQAINSVTRLLMESIAQGRTEGCCFSEITKAIAEGSYLMADEMLIERDKPKEA